jgi:signal transduction histidine kinase
MTLFKNKDTIPRTLLAEFNRSLMLIADRDLLVSNITQKIMQITPVDQIAVFLLNPETEKYTCISKQTNSESFRQLHFTPHSKLVNWLSVNETSLNTRQMKAILLYFSDKEREIIQKTGITLIFPLKIINRLSGFVMLGKRTDNNHFTPHDIDLLTMLFHQAAFAIENTALYEEQSARIKKMYRADRLAITGQLAAGAAHEIRNPLTAIRSTIQYLGKGIKDQTKLEMINELIEEVDRINKIVQGLLTISKPPELETTKVNIEELLQQTLTLLRDTITRKQIQTTINTNLRNTTITADPSQLKQVLLNIILNAIEAMENTPTKQLTINLDPGRTINYQSRYIMITITDTGKGIPQSDAENIFNPFYTTKKDGTGLGLSITYNIINRHGGELEITSPPGKGTTATIKLPQTT